MIEGGFTEGFGVSELCLEPAAWLLDSRGSYKRADSLSAACTVPEPAPFDKIILGEYIGG